MNTFAKNAALKQEGMGKANGDDVQCHSDSEKVSCFYSMPSNHQSWGRSQLPHQHCLLGGLCVSWVVTERVIHIRPYSWAEQRPEAQRGIIPAGQSVSDVWVSMDCLIKGQQEGQLM